MRSVTHIIDPIGVALLMGEAIADVCHCATREYPRFDPACQLHAGMADQPEPVTTPERLTRDLRASIASRGEDAGSTWGEFVYAMTMLGVKHSDHIASIEYGCGLGGNGRLVRDDASDGIEIREAR